MIFYCFSLLRQLYMSAGPTNFPLSSHFVKTWCSGNTGTPTAGVLATQKDSGLYLKCHEKISLISLNRSTLMSWDCLYRQCILDASFTFCYYLNIFLIYCIQSLTLLKRPYGMITLSIDLFILLLYLIGWHACIYSIYTVHYYACLSPCMSFCLQLKK